MNFTDFTGIEHSDSYVLTSTKVDDVLTPKQLFLEDCRAIRVCDDPVAHVSTDKLDQICAAILTCSLRRDKIKRYAVMLAQRRLINSSRKQRRERKHT